MHSSSQSKKESSQEKSRKNIVILAGQDIGKESKNIFSRVGELLTD